MCLMNSPWSLLLVFSISSNKLSSSIPSRSNRTLILFSECLINLMFSLDLIFPIFDCLNRFTNCITLFCSKQCFNLFQNREKQQTHSGNLINYFILFAFGFFNIITRNVRSFALKNKLFVNSITHKLTSLFSTVLFKDCK